MTIEKMLNNYFFAYQATSLGDKTQDAIEKINNSCLLYKV